MVGILIAIAISWALLWLFSREHLTALGIVPNGKRLKEFSIGILPMALFCAFNLMGQAYLQDMSYVRNPDYGFQEMLNGIWWTFKAALFEELIFRGAILYLLIKKLGIKWGCIISAAAFGIYHWFSYQMFGSGLVPMVYVFLLTGAAGWMFAYAFAKTKSIYASLGLHFGWIVVSIVFLSSGPLGDSMFVPQGEESGLSEWEQLFFFLWQTVLVPGMVTWYYVKNYATVKREW